MKQINVKKLLLPNLPYVFIALFATKLGQAARLAPGADFSQKALHIMEGFAAAFQSALPSFHPIDLCVGIAAALLIRLAVYVKGKNARKFRKNIEYGSARWGSAEDIKPYTDPTFANNVILTQTERLTMNSRPKDPKTARNKNVLVVGGSGSGKTRFFIKPNLMQLHSSYVVTDPKGSIVVECGKLLQRNQYKIKILNTINFKKSHHYNPFAYLHSEKDILKLVTTLIANTQGDGKSGDDFWRKAETLLYTALIGYIYYEAPVEEQNFATLIEMINTMEVREDDEDFKNPVDLMFEELAKREPHHFAVRQYAKYRLAAGKTAKSILISCGARLAPFDIQELREITAYDELELDTLGDRKTALFIIISDTDDTFNFLASMVYIDEAALSYAEIKALCAGDERIREKMDLDVDVARLRLMKANHQSQQYRLEDNILRHFPAQIEENKGFLSGFEADMKTLEQHPHPKDGFVGMEVKGDLLTDKDNAGAALLEAFKDAKGLESVPIGSYRGFAMSLTVENFGKDFVLTLKGRMSHRVELGKDARGNLVRIDNALAQMPERYKTVQGRLENVQAQLATAKAELGKPFPQEAELKEKSARLAELNAELNIDDRTPMEQAAENVVAKRPSVLGKLKAPCVHGAGEKKKSHEQEAR